MQLTIREFVAPAVPSLQVGGVEGFVVAMRPHIDEIRASVVERLRSAYELMAGQYRQMPGTPDHSGGAPPDALLA
jgi:hypothetical protein